MVIAKSFARIFFRNAINTGLLVIENAEMADEISNNDILNVYSNKIINLTTGKEYPQKKMDDYIEKILQAGGLINLISEEK